MPRSDDGNVGDVIVLDRARGRIGVAGASCTRNVYGIMSLRPGHGGLIAPAIGFDGALHRTNDLLAGSASAETVLRTITTPTLDSASRYRQFAVATFEGGLARFTGNSVAPNHGDRRGIDVLMQGNSRARPAVLDRAIGAIGAIGAIEKARGGGRPLEEGSHGRIDGGRRGGR